MKVSISLAYERPMLSVDNPRGDWLKSKRDYNSRDGVNRFGSPKSWGPITGSFNRQVLIPVAVLAKIKGMSGEHNDIRHADLEWLKNHMDVNKRLPLIDGKHYVPYIMVWQDGTVWVNEGNHRIMAAAALNIDYLPVMIRYFSGGELEHGPLMPERVMKYDAEGFAAGYSLTEYVK